MCPANGHICPACKAGPWLYVFKRGGNKVLSLGSPAAVLPNHSNHFAINSRYPKKFSAAVNPAKGFDIPLNLCQPR